MAYNLSLSKDQLSIYVKSMDSAARVIASQITNSQNAIAALRNALPDLQRLNEELLKLDVIIDAEDKKDAGSAQVPRETQD
jgi:hypothetical protein